MQQSPELQSRIAVWRQKQKDGTMTLEDWKESFIALRAARMGAQQASAASKARKGPVDVGALKNSLLGLKKAP